MVIWKDLITVTAPPAEVLSKASSVLLLFEPIHSSLWLASGASAEMPLWPVTVQVFTGDGGLAVVQPVRL